LKLLVIRRACHGCQSPPARGRGLKQAVRR